MKDKKARETIEKLAEVLGCSVTFFESIPSLVMGTAKFSTHDELLSTIREANRQFTIMDAKIKAICDYLEINIERNESPALVAKKRKKAAK